MKFVGNPKELPTRTRNGVWKDLFRNEFSQNPGKLYEYVDVSSSTASNLQRDYGLTATTMTVDDVLHLYVKWVPEDAERIKASYKPKPKASKKADGNGQAEAQAPAGASK